MFSMSIVGILLDLLSVYTVGASWICRNDRSLQKWSSAGTVDAPSLSAFDFSAVGSISLVSETYSTKVVVIPIGRIR